jgi:hypothetical protein
VEELVVGNYSRARSAAEAALATQDPAQRRIAAWVMALAALETLPTEKMEPYYNLLIKEDSRVKNSDEAREALFAAKGKLERLRDYFSRAY